MVMHHFNSMNKKDKLTVGDIVKGSAFEKVCAILRENDYTYTHDDGGYYNFTPEEIEIIKEALMKEPEKEREYAQEYINFYNALVQYSNFISNSAANYNKEMEKLSIYVDIHEMFLRVCKVIMNNICKRSLKIEKSFSIPFVLTVHETNVLMKFNSNGTLDIDIENQGNLLDVMRDQSARTTHALAVFKAWVEVGKELIGKDYDNPIMKLIPFNFVDYLTPPFYQAYPEKYYISKESGRDPVEEEDKFAVFPNYKFTSNDPDGEKAAKSILNVTLKQWQISKEKILAIRKRLKKA